MKKNSRRNAWLGFWGSTLFHGGLAVMLIVAFVRADNELPPVATNTAISMQMMTAMVVEEPTEKQETVEPEKVEKLPEPEKKEWVADPRLKPEKPKEKKKEQKKPKPKEKLKPEDISRKDKPKEMKVKSATPKSAVKSQIVSANDNIANSQANTALTKAVNPNSAGMGTNSSEISAYQSALRREIERHKRYPQRARIMQKQGTVVIGFNIESNGDLTGERVVKSSGVESLDDSALQAVQRAKSVGTRPAGMGSYREIPIQFRIQ